MTIIEFYTVQCEKEFLTHKNNFVEKINFTEKNRKINVEDYSKFNRELKKFQRKISLNLTKLVKSNRDKNVEEILEPIANSYVKKFLNIVDLSKLESGNG
jgi:Ni,Fe-hydrogenase maturation factor